ncbi:Os10g0483700, partial [Oryza sativa Japonica Group]
KTSSNHKTRYVRSLNYTKLVTIGHLAVLIPVLSYVAAETAWAPHVGLLFLSLLSLPLLSLFSGSGQAGAGARPRGGGGGPAGRGGRGGPAAGDVAAAAAETTRDQGSKAAATTTTREQGRASAAARVRSRLRHHQRPQDGAMFLLHSRAGFP